MHQRVVQIVREEMNAIGAHEMLMPVLQPADYWRRTGRYDIDELFKLKDRRGADMVLAMTHEEIVTTHVAAAVKSYRELPLILYHFQVKERDEPRPRAGVLRTREFVMKDSYSFDRDPAGLDASYQKHVVAYDRMMDRCGLEWYRVEADVGMMGGSGAHEYMAPCPAGENDVAVAAGYAANVEVASAEPQPVTLEPALDAPVARRHARDDHDRRRRDRAGGAGGRAAQGVPGDRRRRRDEARGRTRRPSRQRDQARGRARDRSSAPPIPTRCRRGSGRPATSARWARRCRSCSTPASADGGYVVGANEPDAHLRGVEPGRDFPFERVDVRTVMAGDTVNGSVIRIEPAIEVGNIFKLGTRYSLPLGARYLDEAGQEQLIHMGCYGFGPARAAAAAVEQYADEQGISWPRTIAPFDVELVTLGKAGSDERALSDRLYEELCDLGLDTLYDERDAGPGEKFTDAELLGCPLRVTVGRRTLSSGEVEVQIRRGKESRTVPVDGAAEAVAELWRGLP